MEAFIVGLLYALLGVVLLFFGAKFMTVVLTVLGGLFGINLGQVLVSWWGLDGLWAFLLVALCAIAVAYLTVMFYTIFIAGVAGYFLGVVSYALAMNWNASHTWAVLIGLFFALVGFLAVWRLNLVENMFKFITSIQGAIALVGGTYVIFHSARLDTLQTNFYDVLLGASFWWIVLWVVLFCAGFGYQLRTRTDFFTK